jgi:BirA family biotin operon repressor/biotin-[acetyl-CoA-carboxylase] ligase
LKIVWLKRVDSTQTYLLDHLKQGLYTEATMVVAQSQTAGKGSRGNSWIGLEGNLFFSFCLQKSQLPKDLPLSATSIYFSFLLKQILAYLGSKVWMKWPNDFYLEDQKIGGTITNVSSEWFVCGIGINVKKAPESFAYLDINIDIETLLLQYQKSLKNLPPWKKLLKEFEIEFTKSRSFSAHIGEKKVALTHAKLADDGALIIDDQRIYSLR